MNRAFWPFDTSGFVPRWQLQRWSSELGWTHIVSDCLIWLAYIVIPALLLFYLKRRRDVPFPRLLWLFVTLTLVCGTAHLIDALIFWEPVFRLLAVVKFLTAVVAWATIFALIPILPRALAMRSPTELENEIESRASQLMQTNEMLQREVRERLRAEREILEQREWLQVILRSIGDGIVATDCDGKVKLLNPAAEALTGYRQDEALGQPLNEVLRIRTQGDEERTESLWNSSEARTLIQSVIEERGLVHRDGTERTVELRLNPIRFSGSLVSGTVLSFADITDRKAIEEKSLQSHKLESVGRLAGGVAHDFNNMLTIINGCSDLALSTISPIDPIASLLSEIRTAGARAAELTRQLLAFSRRQLISPQLLDLSEIVVDTEQMLARLLGEDIRLVTTLEPRLGPVLADRGQIQQVLINLALNARDAMPQGGDLSIATHNASLDEPYARAQVDVRAGKFVILEVSDSGEGLDDEIKARIFEPFITNKPTGRGTGLGLAVVHGIVTQAGGHIDVSSEKGKGTVFRMCLPQVETDRSPQVRTNGTSSDMLSGAETILVVEDDQGVRNFLDSALAKFGYRVLMAADVDSAVGLAHDQKSPIDLLITDVVMPGGGGSAVAERILAMHAKTKVLFISGYTNEAVTRSGVIYEKVELLDKPFTAKVLAAKVREMLDQ